MMAGIAEMDGHQCKILIDKDLKVPGFGSDEVMSGWSGRTTMGAWKTRYKVRPGTEYRALPCSYE
jgi:hypothetical protein